jgi:hypothetical protein
VNCGRKKLQIPGEEECLCGNAAATVAAEQTAKTRQTHSISGILLGAFAKLRKTLSHVTVCPNGKLDSHWKDFHEIWYLRIFLKSMFWRFNEDRIQLKFSGADSRVKVWKFYIVPGNDSAPILRMLLVTLCPALRYIYLCPAEAWDGMLANPFNRLSSLAQAVYRMLCWLFNYWLPCSAYREASHSVEVSRM